MPPSLDNLAAELHIAIISCFEDEDFDIRRKILHTLCLTTQRLNVAATPHLYRVIFTPYCNRQWSLQPLLRTLCYSPDLLKHMRAIALGPFSTDCYAPHSDHLVVQKLQELSQTVSEVRQLSEQTKFGRFAADMLLLMCMAKHVKFMCFFMRAYSEDEDVTVADQVSCWQQLFDICSKETAKIANSRLEAIQLRGEARPWLKRGDSFAALVPFLNQPSLRTLICSGLASLEGSTEWTAEPNTSNVTELELDGCYPSTSDTVQILTACKSLCNLTMRWDRQEIDMDDALEAPHKVDQQVIIAALVKHATTLEELIITNLADGGQSFKSRTGSLGPFKALQTLEVDEKVLAGWLVWRHAALDLPPNLVHLTVHMNRDSLDEHGFINDVLLAISRCELQRLESLAISYNWVRVLTESHLRQPSSDDGRRVQWPMTV